MNLQNLCFVYYVSYFLFCYLEKNIFHLLLYWNVIWLKVNWSCKHVYMQKRCFHDTFAIHHLYEKPPCESIKIFQCCLEVIQSLGVSINIFLLQYLGFARLFSWDESFWLVIFILFIVAPYFAHLNLNLISVISLDLCKLEKLTRNLFTLFLVTLDKLNKEKTNQTYQEEELVMNNFLMINRCCSNWLGFKGNTPDNDVVFYLISIIWYSTHCWSWPKHLVPLLFIRVSAVS